MGHVPAVSDTLLQLAGGWVSPEDQIAERGREAAFREFHMPPHHLPVPLGVGARAAAAAESFRLPPKLPPLRTLLRSAYFNVALSRDGRVFIWRNNVLFAATMTHRVPEVPTLMLPPGEQAVDVAVGEGHVVILVKTGRVWTVGWQQPSALGRGPRLSMDAAMVAVPVPGLKNVIQICASANFTLAVDDRGTLFLFGEGPCVIGCFSDPHAVYYPRPVPAAVFGGRRVLAAACGEGHVAVLTAWDPARRLPLPGAWFAEEASRGRAAAARSAAGARPKAAAPQ